jgi:hypothetical protein
VKIQISFILSSEDGRGGVWYDGSDGLYKCFYCAGWSDGRSDGYLAGGSPESVS